MLIRTYADTDRHELKEVGLEEDSSFNQAGVWYNTNIYF